MYQFPSPKDTKARKEKIILGAWDGCVSLQKATTTNFVWVVNLPCGVYTQD